MKMFSKKNCYNKTMAVKTDRNLLIADYHLKHCINNFKIAAENGNHVAEQILHMFCMSGLPVQRHA